MKAEKMMKRPRKSSGNVLNEQIDSEERNELLELLNSHGRSFMDSFELNPSPLAQTKVSKKKRKVREINEATTTEGISPELILEDPGPSTRHVPDVVIFDERPNSSAQPIVRGKKGFMSSKINHVIESPTAAQTGPPPSEDADSEEEESNTRNDKMLHELVHSQLLNNTQAFDPNQGSAKRSRIMAGRLVELADGAKVGQGALSLVAKERSRHAQRVRIGLREKAKQREIKALEQAKTLGNYHPSIKKNFTLSGSKAGKQRRERGLGLGIGRFRNGALTLSRDELRHVQGTSDRGAKGGRGMKP